jgi:hypothetical protein
MRFPHRPSTTYEGLTAMSYHNADAAARSATPAVVHQFGREQLHRIVTYLHKNAGDANPAMISP